MILHFIDRYADRQTDGQVDIVGFHFIESQTDRSAEDIVFHLLEIRRTTMQAGGQTHLQIDYFFISLTDRQTNIQAHRQKTGVALISYL